MRRGFTIVELMVSVGIIAILLTIVIVAAGGAQGKAREHRAVALQTALEQAIAAYYAELGEWPSAIETKANSGGTPNADKGHSFVFTEDETDSVFREVVGKAFGNSKGSKAALVDVKALFVARTASLKENASGWGCPHCGRGCELSQMMAPGEDSASAINQLSFGYPCSDHGRFCRFWIKYNVPSDAVTVLMTKP